MCPVYFGVTTGAFVHFPHRTFYRWLNINIFSWKLSWKVGEPEFLSSWAEQPIKQQTNLSPWIVEWGPKRPKSRCLLVCSVGNYRDSRRSPDHYWNWRSSECLPPRYQHSSQNVISYEQISSILRVSLKILFWHACISLKFWMCGYRVYRSFFRMSHWKAASINLIIFYL